MNSAVMKLADLAEVELGKDIVKLGSGLHEVFLEIRYCSRRVVSDAFHALTPECLIAFSSSSSSSSLPLSKNE